MYKPEKTTDIPFIVLTSFSLLLRYTIGGYGLNFTLNFTFILYLISYISLPFYFIIPFFYNIIELIIFEISVLQYPVSILPFGIGSMLSELFYLILIIVVITGIKIVSSGFGE